MYQIFIEINSNNVDIDGAFAWRKGPNAVVVCYNFMERLMVSTP